MGETNPRTQDEAMTTKEHLHLLVDALSEDEASDLLRYTEEHAGASHTCPHCGRTEHVLNEETERALRDAEAKVGLIRHRSVSDLFTKLGLARTGIYEDLSGR
jgi:hypothetical protein